MHNKLLISLLCGVLIFCLVGCEPRSIITESFDGADVPGLEWGMSRDEVYKALDITEKDTERYTTQDGENIFEDTIVKNVELDGEPVSLMLSFSSEKDNDMLGFDLGLTRVKVLCYDKETYDSISKKIAPGLVVIKDTYKQAVELNIWDKVEIMIGNLHNDNFLNMYNVQHRNEKKEEYSELTDADINELIKMIAESVKAGVMLFTSDDGSKLTFETSKLLEKDEFYGMISYGGQYQAMINHAVADTQ